MEESEKLVRLDTTTWVNLTSIVNNCVNDWNDDD